MGFCKFTWKAFLILINSIFLGLGWILIGFGIWVLNTNSHFDNTWIFIAHFETIIPKSLITVGVITTLIAFLGFWGSCANKKWMLQGYASILLVTLFVQICIGVVATNIAADNDMSEVIASFKMRAEGIKNNETKVVDFIQWTYECCGYDHPSMMKYQNGQYPESCCGFMIESAECLEPIYDIGCKERYWKLIQIGSLTYIAFAGFQLLCIGVAYNLAASMGKKNKVAEPSLYARMG